MDDARLRTPTLIPLGPLAGVPTFRQALERGFAAPNVGEAFFEGYQAALHALDPALEPGAVGSFCVTEAGGGHPRAVQTCFTRDETGGVLDGEKTFVSGFDRASTLLVVAREGERDDGTPRLVMLRVPRATRGVEGTLLPPLPFASGVAHARVRFAAVRVAAVDVLPGDGYLDYVKPFRTVEDVHVVAAVGAMLVALASAREAEAEAECLLAALAALGVVAADPRAPTAHLVLAGALTTVRDAVASLRPLLDDRPDVVRDLALLKVAEKAREARRAAAWTRIRAEG